MLAALNPLLDWMNQMMEYQSTDVKKVSGDYRTRVLAVKESLNSDVSGMVNSILDFAINAALTKYVVGTGNPNFTTILKKWLGDINSELRGKIPTGLQPLAKEYFRERWKGSSLLLLRTRWEKVMIEGQLFEVPTKLWFVDGEDIVVKDGDNETKVIGEYTYHLRVNDNKTKKLPTNSKNEMIFVQKPYESWSAQNTIPFLMRRGIWKNLSILSLLVDKGEAVIAKALEYLFLLKKGSPELAQLQDPNFMYSDEDLQAVQKSFKDFLSIKKTTKGVSSYVTNFDTNMEHIIPEYERAIKSALYTPIEKRILAGLGLIEILEGIGSTRKESILNPKPFIAEVETGIADFKMLLFDIMTEIKMRNKGAHKKYVNVDVWFRNNPIKDFINERVKQVLRSVYDRGGLSIKTFVELVGDTDFETEMERRKKEKKDGIEDLMYPHVTQNLEATLSPAEERREKVKKPNPDKKKDTNKDGPEKKNFKQASTIKDVLSPEYLDDYIRVVVLPESDFIPDSFRLVQRSTYGGIKMILGRVAQEAGDPIEKVHSYLFNSEMWTDEIAHAWVDEHKDNEQAGNELPDFITKALSRNLWSTFASVFDDSLTRNNDETQAFKNAWAVIAKIARRTKKGKWVKKAKADVSKAMQEVAEETSFGAKMDVVDTRIKAKKEKLLDKLLEDEDK